MLGHLNLIVCPIHKMLCLFMLHVLPFCGGCYNVGHLKISDFENVMPFRKMLWIIWLKNVMSLYGINIATPNMKCHKTKDSNVIINYDTT